MKNAYIALAITAVILVFLLGFWTGRNFRGETVFVGIVREPYSGTKIDINVACAGELDFLPGIGTILGERIVEYRNIHGPFSDISELKNVDGITDRIYDNIKDMICTGGNHEDSGS